MTRRLPWRWLYWLVAISLSGVLLYISLRGIDWRRVAELLGTLRPGWTLAAIAFASLAHLIRAARWRVLLSAQGRVPFLTVFWANSAGYFANNVLPARAGELVRTFAVSAGTGFSASYVLTTGLAERIADAIALVAISSAVLFTATFRPGWLANAARPFAFAAGCGLVTIALLPRMERVARSWLLKLPVPAALKEKLTAILTQVVLGLRSFHNARRFARFAAFTAIVWCTDAAGSLLAAHALRLSMSLPSAFLLIAALGLGSAIPSTPGYVGVYQFVAVTVLAPFGFSRADAIAFIVFVQAQQYLLVTVLGLVGFSRYKKLTSAEAWHTAGLACASRRFRPQSLSPTSTG